MKMTLKGLLPLIVFLLIIGALAIRLTSGESTRDLPSQLINRPFPEFSLPDLFDESINVDNSYFEGQVVLVNVFGSWCATCDQEHPTLRRLARDGEIVMLGIDWRDTREKGLRWLARRGNPYTRTVFDEYSTLAIDLGVTGAPESFFVDKKGQIRYKYIGPITEQVWAQELKPIAAMLEAEQ